MTSPADTPGTWRQCTLGLTLPVAVGFACETRRPEPFVPVASYVSAEERAAAGRPVVAPYDDFDRHALELELHETVPARALERNASDPLLLIYDANGTLVHDDRVPSGRSGAALGADTLPYPASTIAPVDISKALGQLPPQARAGIIRVRPKPIATTSPDAVSDEQPVLRLTPTSRRERRRGTVPS